MEIPRFIPIKDFSFRVKTPVRFVAAGLLLAATGCGLFDRSSIIQPSQGEVEWSNTNPDVEFDPKAAKDIYEAFATLGKGNLRFDTIMFKGQLTNNEVVNIVVSPKPKFKTKFKILSPKDKLPEWAKPGDSEGLNQREGVIEAFVVVYKRPEQLPSDLQVAVRPEDFTNDNFNFVVCESTLNITASNPKFLNASHEDVEKTAVKAFCNSIVLALSIRRNGESYDNYDSLLKNNLFRTGYQGLLDYLLLQIPRTDFNRLPTGKPISYPTSE